MPAPDYPRSGFVSKRTSRVKHVAIVDRKMSKVPFRPLCNAHSESDEIRMVGDRETSAAGEIVWWVDLNGTAFKGKRVCQNCMRVVEELWSAVSGVDSDIEEEYVTKTGRVLTDEEIEQLSEEAGREYRLLTDEEAHGEVP